MRRFPVSSGFLHRCINASARWRTASTKTARTRSIMTIELDKDVRDEAVASLQRYFAENMDEQIGNLQAGALLSFFVEEIGPVIYNLAIQDAQERLLARVSELDIECHEDTFGYWKKYGKRR
jgi:uncharacterized protein (DUF2164 family)